MYLYSTYVSVTLAQLAHFVQKKAGFSVILFLSYQSVFYWTSLQILSHILFDSKDKLLIFHSSTEIHVISLLKMLTNNIPHRVTK